MSCLGRSEIRNGKGHYGFDAIVNRKGRFTRSRGSGTHPGGPYLCGCRGFAPRAGADLTEINTWVGSAR